MQKKIFKKIQKMFIFFGIGVILSAALLGINLTKVKAAGVSATASALPLVPDAFTLAVSPSDWTNANTAIVTFGTTDVNSDIYEYQIKVDSGSYYTTDTSPYNLDISGLSDGIHTVTVKATDNTDNSTEESALIKIDRTLPIMTAVTATLTSDNQVKLSWNLADDVTSGIDHFEIYRGGIWLADLNASFTSFIDTDQQVISGQNYEYQVIAVDAAGNPSQPETANIFVPEVVITPIITTTITETEEVTPPVIQPAISYGVSTYSPAPVPAEVKAAETSLSIDTNTNTIAPQEEESSSNWNKLLLAISILIIAAGAAVGGYYGYQWWMMQKDNDDEPKEDKKNNSKSRW